MYARRLQEDESQSPPNEAGACTDEDKQARSLSASLKASSVSALWADSINPTPREVSSIPVTRKPRARRTPKCVVARASPQLSPCPSHLSDPASGNFHSPSRDPAPPPVVAGATKAQHCFAARAEIRLKRVADKEAALTDCATATVKAKGTGISGLLRRTSGREYTNMRPPSVLLTRTNGWQSLNFQSATPKSGG